MDQTIFVSKSNDPVPTCTCRPVTIHEDGDFKSSGWPNKVRKKIKIFSKYLLNNLCCQTWKKSVLEELQACLEGHLLQGRSVRSYAYAIKWLVHALEGHVVGNERQVPVVYVDAVGAENLFDFLEDSTQILALCKETRFKSKKTYIYDDSVCGFDTECLRSQVNVVQVQPRCV